VSSIDGVRKGKPEGARKASVACCSTARTGPCRESPCSVLGGDYMDAVRLARVVERGCLPPRRGKVKHGGSATSAGPQGAGAYYLCVCVCKISCPKAMPFKTFFHSLATFFFPCPHRTSHRRARLLSNPSRSSNQQHPTPQCGFARNNRSGAGLVPSDAVAAVAVAGGRRGGGPD
jgi:hypothetical protein